MKRLSFPDDRRGFDNEFGPPRPAAVFVRVNTTTPSVGAVNDAHSDCSLTSSSIRVLSCACFSFAAERLTLWRLRYHLSYCNQQFSAWSVPAKRGVGLGAASSWLRVLAMREFVGIGCNAFDESLATKTVRYCECELGFGGVHCSAIRAIFAENRLFFGQENPSRKYSWREMVSLLEQPADDVERSPFGGQNPRCDFFQLDFRDSRRPSSTKVYRLSHTGTFVDHHKMRGGGRNCRVTYISAITSCLATVSISLAPRSCG